MATTKNETVKQKTFKNTDLISCRSITNGELFFIGKKTDEVYSFADYGYETEIEYQDLIYAVKQKNATVFAPKFIITNNDFVEQNKELKEFYSSIYSLSDLDSILECPLAKMTEIVKTLPVGAQDALKGLVATRIAEGTFDSANKIKALDEILGTKMMFVLADDN